MLLETEGKGSCAAIEALARLAPESSLENGMIASDITSVLKPYVAHHKIPAGGIEVRDLDCPGLSLSETRIYELSFRNANLVNSKFTNVDISGARFQHADLRGATFSDGVQWYSEQAGSTTDFSDSDLRSSYFNPMPHPEITGGIFHGAMVKGALFTWIDGENLKENSSIDFTNGICLPLPVSWKCQAWHKDKLLEIETGKELPTGCPSEILGPIIQVYGHTEDLERCENWLKSAQQ